MAFFIYLFKDCIAKTNNEALHVAFFCSYANLLLWFNENITQIYPLAEVSLCETGTVWGNWTEPIMPDGIVSGCFGIILCACSVVYKKHIESTCEGKTKCRSWLAELCVNRVQARPQHLAALIFLLGFLLVCETAWAPPFVYLFFCTELLK